jgi:hypothetical protein
MTAASKYAFDQVKNNYNLPFIKIGINVVVNGKQGKISGVSNSGLKAKLIENNKEISFHPTWETAYFDDDMNTIKDFRSKK